MFDSILIIDFGSQLTKLIARRIREQNIYCEIQSFQTISKDILKQKSIKGIILSGGPSSVHEDHAPRLPDILLQLNVPILGICYGQQLICQHFGGKVKKGQGGEFGAANVTIHETCPLFHKVWLKNKSYRVWMSHGDHVVDLPQGFKRVGSSGCAPHAIIYHEEKKIYGVQFHPEVVHTPDGEKLLKNFAQHICQCSPNWTMTRYEDSALDQIKSQVKNGRVICGLSGGVDSAVTAALIHKAIGDQLTCIFVDHGFLRLGEAQEVVDLFQKHYPIKLIYVDACERFLKKIGSETDPEKKRKIIGNLFIDIFEEQAKSIGDVDFLAQGTLYPDVIESLSFASGNQVTIKSHHNVGGLPQRMHLKLVEPLRELFKDEVRELGRQLGLPREFISRHPFPGPGLAIRIPGQPITKEKLDILRKADSIYIEELKNNDLYDKIWQAFTVLLPVRTVGVMGDSRTYDYACALRAVTSTDGMTAQCYRFDREILHHISTRIVNEVQGINRVTYDITSKPPGTIEWE